MFAGRYGYPANTPLYVIVRLSQDWVVEYVSSITPVITWNTLPFCAFAWEDESAARSQGRKMLPPGGRASGLHLGQLEFYDTGLGLKPLPLVLLT